MYTNRGGSRTIRFQNHPERHGRSERAVRLGRARARRERAVRLERAGLKMSRMFRNYTRPRGTRAPSTVRPKIGVLGAEGMKTTQRLRHGVISAATTERLVQICPSKSRSRENTDDTPNQ